MYLYVIVGVLLVGLLAWAEGKREAANARYDAWRRFTQERWQ